MTSQRLSAVTEDCSIVRGRQLRTLCHQRWCRCASRRMFGSLWNAVAAHEHRRQDGSRRPKVTIRPGFSRTVLYYWVLSWISRCPGFVLDLKSSGLPFTGKCVSFFQPDGKLYEIWSVDSQQNKMIKIVATRRQISRQNASNSISAGASPETPLGELTALPQTPSWIKGSYF